MKKRNFLMILILVSGLLVGCSDEGKDSSESNDFTIENNSSQSIEQPSSENMEQPSSESSELPSSEIAENYDVDLNDEIKIDYNYDYSADIKADVDYVVSGSANLQTELENIEKIIQKYTPLATSAQTQLEMNLSSKWFLVIWDTELNSLWSRFSDSADQQTKDALLAQQRNWIAMKEEVTLLSLGPREENGSMYPLLQNSFLEEITKNRAYVLANELAKITGESFVLPERSEKYGLYVDNQGTGIVYSSLLTRQGWEGDEEAIISIYRQGTLEGTFVDNGNGELAFTSDDGSVKGMIKIGGWDGASFQVTEISGESPFSVGEAFQFPFSF